MSDRYRIERSLGEGGSATVYLAQDLKLGRPVALKVLRPEIAAAVGADRFIREIKLTARLQHPHIVSVIDSGIAVGLPYFTLPYVAGESLRQLLRRTGQLELGEAVRLASEIADAIAYAHAQGIIHRDIKPENVLLSDGHAVVTDFGLAKAVTEAGGERLTATGIAMGTPSYMSPEQGGAHTIVDARADEYSLACVLYEMLAGEPPFAGNTPQMVVARHMHQAPPPIRVVRRTVNAATAAVLEKALAKSPADRYPSVAEFAAALERAPGTPDQPATGRRLAIVAPVVALVVLASWVAWQRGRGNAGVTDLALDPSHVAVMELGAPGASPELAAFAANLTNRLTDGLSAIDALTVSSRRAVAPYEKAAVPLDSVARALRAGTLITGSVENDGTRVRVALELIDGRTGHQLAITHAEATTSERHLLVDAAADTVTRLLRQALGRSIQKRRQLLETSSVAAFDRVEAAEERLVGFEGQLNDRDLRAAHRTLDDADSLFAAAERLDTKWIEPIVQRSRLSENRIMLANAERLPADQWLRAGLAHAERAVRLAPDDPRALQMRGQLRYRVWNQSRSRDTLGASALRDSAEADLRAAIDGNPDRSRVLRVLSEVVAAAGRPGEAVNLAERAYRVDPYLEGANRILLRLFDFNLELGKDSAAARWCGEGAARFPDEPTFFDCQLQLMAWTTTKPADPAAARRLKGLTLGAFHASLRATLEPHLDLLVGIVDARAGARDSARAILRRGLAVVPSNLGIVIPAAQIHVLLGERTEAVDLLIRYTAQHPEYRDFVRRSPALRALGNDTRLTAALAQPSRS